MKRKIYVWLLIFSVSGFGVLRAVEKSEWERQLEEALAQLKKLQQKVQKLKTELTETKKVVESDTPFIREDVPQEQDWIEYTVRKGETLSGIAVSFYGSFKKWREIWEWNKGVLKKPEDLREGMKIRLKRKGLKKNESQE